MTQTSFATTHYSSESIQAGTDILKYGQKAIVGPTKVGYIIMATDTAGLEIKFDAKNRKRSKPAVTLCSSVEQVAELAQTTPEIIEFYKTHQQQGILLGCILPWKEEAKKYIPDGCQDFVMDQYGTSCFVIEFGKPSQEIVTKLWQEEKKLTFASSANPSGQGNRGKVEGIGQRIADAMEMIIEADDYVSSIQPDKNQDTRYEQGVMVSMVDADKKLIPTQDGQRMIQPCPVVIRKGLDIDTIMKNLSQHFDSWDYRHGQYY